MANTQIFNCGGGWDTKVNFVDSNNVLLGYDLGQSWCENAFWSVGQNKDGSDPLHKGDEEKHGLIPLDGYEFDPKFLEREDNEDGESYVAIFKLVNYDDKPDLFIRLENHHNGYYSHGFTFKTDKIVEDSL